MIVVQGRELLIPDADRYIGKNPGAHTEIRQFKVPKVTASAIDLSGMTFYLRLQYQNAGIETILLTKEVENDYIILTWDITLAELDAVGTVDVQIRVTDGTTIRWTSYTASLYIDRHLNIPVSYVGNLTELEQIEQDHAYMLGVVDELRDNIDYTSTAEAWAVGTRDGVAVPSTDETYHNNSKYYRQYAERFAKGTEDGTAVTSGDGYLDNAKYWKQQSERYAAGKEDGTDVTSGIGYHDNAKYYAEQSDIAGEKWSRGTVDNVPVGSDDETYHNNAKYYSEQSDGYSNVSEAYAKGTVDGTAVTSGQTGYQDNAKYYKEQIQSRLNQIDANTSNIAVQTARIDQFTHLAEGSTTGDAELMDARVGADGVTYASAGAAVRANDSLLKSQLKIKTQGNPFLTWAFTNPANTVHSSENDKIDCYIPEGNTFIIIRSLQYISAYATYSDDTTELISGEIITDDNLTMKCTASKTIVQIGFYVPSVSYDRHVSAIIITNPVGLDAYNNTEKTNLALNEINVVGNTACLFDELSVSTTAPGWRLNDNGLCSSDNNYKLLKYQVTAGDRLKIVSDYKFQFQTVASVPSTGSNNRVGATYQNGEYFVTVPDTATYLIISTPTTSNANAYYCLSAAGSKLNMYFSPPFEIANKRFNYTSGAPVTSNGCQMTGYIPCAEGDIVDYYGYSFYYNNAPVMYCVAFLADDLSVINGKTQIDGQTATTSKNGKITVTAPAGTAYVVGSNNSTSITPYLHVYSYERTLTEDTDKRTQRKELIQRIKMARHIPGNYSERITLLHFSDSHQDDDAVNRIMADRAFFGNYIDDVICTGDFCADENDSTFSTWWNPSVMLCIGNHDVAKNEGGTYDWAYLSMADRASRYITPYAEGWGVTHESGKSYYYKDYAANLRLIVLDTMLYNLSGTEADDQETWLTNLLDDAIIKNLHVLIACHSPHGGAVAKECSFSRVGQGAMPTYQDCNTPQSIIDIVAAKITGGLKFVGYLVGHTHQDNIWDAENDGKQLMYCVTDARGNSANYWKNSDQHRDTTLDAYNIVTVDTRNTLVKIIRGGGADMDDHMRTRKGICINYSTGEIVGQVL